MKQLLFRDTFKPKHYTQINKYQRKNILWYHMFIKSSRDVKIKIRTVLGGNNKRDFLYKENISLPTVVTKLYYCSVKYLQKRKGVYL